MKYNNRFTKNDENKAMYSFIKEHHEQIIERGLKNVDLPRTAENVKQVLNTFKSNYYERIKESLEDRKRKLVTEALSKKILKNTLHSVAFTGADIIEKENIVKALQNAKEWERFRTLNRHQKFELDLLKEEAVPKGSTNIRRQFLYKGKENKGFNIRIKLIYKPGDTGFSFTMERV